MGENGRFEKADSALSTRYTVMMLKRRIPYFFKGDKGKRRAKIAVGCAVVLAAIALAVLVFNPEPMLLESAEIRSIENRGVLRVGVRTDMPGLGFEGEGLEVELASRLVTYILPGRDLASALELVPVTAKTVTAKLDDGSIDVAICMMRKDGYSSCVYSGTYYVDPVWLAVKAGEEGLSIDGLSIGYVTGTPSETALKSYAGANPDKGISTSVFASYPDMLAALDKGVVDGISLTGTHYIKYREEHGLNIHGTMLGTVNYAIASSTDTPPLVQIADMMIYDLMDSGELDSMIERHGLFTIADNEDSEG